MTLSELFKDLTEDKHCTRYLAVDEDGISCYECCRNAKRWCAVGWIWRYLWDSEREQLDKANELQHYAKSLGYDEASTANDNMGYTFIKSIQENCK